MEKYVRTGKVTDVRPKEKIGFITIWQLLYPILIYFGAQIIASIIGIIVIVAQNPNIIEDREKYVYAK